MTAPIEYTWKDGAWHPLPYWRKAAAAQFGEGEIARLERLEYRSVASHRQFFAWISDVYDNLPEAIRGRWVTPDDLRHWILTYTRFCTREEFVCSSKAEATRWVRNLNGKYHRVEIEGNTVIGYTAHSQAQRAMSGRAFQESRDAVATACAQILGVSVEELKHEGGRAA